jgi:hypothetical protein
VETTVLSGVAVDVTDKVRASLTARAYENATAHVAIEPVAVDFDEISSITTVPLTATPIAQ